MYTYSPNAMRGGGYTTVPTMHSPAGATAYPPGSLAQQYMPSHPAALPPSPPQVMMWGPQPGAAHGHSGGQSLSPPSLSAPQAYAARQGQSCAPGATGSAQPSAPLSGALGDVMFYVMSPNAAGEMTMRPVYGPAGGAGSYAASAGGTSSVFTPGVDGSHAMRFAVPRTPGNYGSAPTALNTMLPQAAMPLSELSAANAHTLWHTKGTPVMDANNYAVPPRQNPGSVLPTNPVARSAAQALPPPAPQASHKGKAGPGDTKATGYVDNISEPSTTASKKASKKKKKCNGVQYVIGHVYEGFVKRYNPLRGFGFLTATHELVPASTQLSSPSSPREQLPDQAEKSAAAVDLLALSAEGGVPGSLARTVKTLDSGASAAARASRSEQGLSGEEATGSSHDERHASSDDTAPQPHQRRSHSSGSLGEVSDSADRQASLNTTFPTTHEGNFAVTLSSGKTALVRRERSCVGDIFVHQSYVHMRGFRALPVGGRVRFEIGYLEGQQSLQAVDVVLLEDGAEEVDAAATADVGARVANRVATPPFQSQDANALPAGAVPRSFTVPPPSSTLGGSAAAQLLESPMGHDVPSALFANRTPASQLSNEDDWLRSEELLSALTRD